MLILFFCLLLENIINIYEVFKVYWCGNRGERVRLFFLLKFVGEGKLGGLRLSEIGFDFMIVFFIFYI